MKSSLRDGKLPPPLSLVAAKARYDQLYYEIQKIEKQLVDLNRRERLGDVNYELWSKKATSALRYMKKEADQLAIWIDRHPDSDLFREVHELLLQLRDEVDLEPKEAALIARLDTYYQEGASDVTPFRFRRQQ